MKEELSFYEAEVQSILGLPPNWLLWSGGYLIIALFIGFVAMGMFWRHPDSVPVETSLYQPANLQTLHLPAGARIDSIFVSDRQQIQKGEPILYFWNGGLREALKSPYNAQVYYLGEDAGDPPLALMPDADPQEIQVLVEAQHLPLLKVGQKVSLYSSQQAKAFGHIDEYFPVEDKFVVAIRTENPTEEAQFKGALQLNFILNDQPIFAKLLSR
ncbi:MAG: hypothetical protein AAFQ87_25800 [Bacteroidota bacterium]